MFKIVDEKLGLASCSISDLTMQQVQAFLSKWEEGAKIESLTLFYDEIQKMVVVNQDHKDFDLYLQIAEAYMSVSDNGREELRREAPESLKETLNVLEAARGRMVHDRFRKDL